MFNALCKVCSNMWCMCELWFDWFIFFSGQNCFTLLVSSHCISSIHVIIFCAEFWCLSQARKMHHKVNMQLLTYNPLGSALNLYSSSEHNYNFLVNANSTLWLRIFAQRQNHCQHQSETTSLIHLWPQDLFFPSEGWYTYILWHGCLDTTPLPHSTLEFPKSSLTLRTDTLQIQQIQGE